MHTVETDRPVLPRVFRDEGSTTLLSTISFLLSYALSAARRDADSVSSSAIFTLLFPRSAYLMPSQRASSTAG
jgi:hypothetical protein